MARFSANGAELEYETVGTGEPLVLIHGVLIGDSFAPLLAEPGLTRRYQVTNYHRRGYLTSSAHSGPCSIAQQAADALAIIRHVAGGRAHVVGHSYGGTIALQLAVDAPDAVHSLSLLEAGLPVASLGTVVPPYRVAYESGDKAGALDAFLTMAIGPGYRASIDKTLARGWFEQSVADIDTVFQREFPALREWQFTGDLARSISQPALLVVGAESPETRFNDQVQLRTWLPQAESFVLPGVSHGLQIQDSRGIADRLVEFLARHPMPASVPA